MEPHTQLTLRPARSGGTLLESMLGKRGGLSVGAIKPQRSSTVLSAQVHTQSSRFLAHRPIETTGTVPSPGSQQTGILGSLPTR